MSLTSVNLMEKNDDFKPTVDELRTISEKMKDPEFRKLWNEYAESLRDPETLREEEEYLRQVEREAKEGGNYTFDFVFPKPRFVVKLLQAEKTYINICDSDKVDEFREETTGDSRGSHWHVPVSIGPMKEEQFEGQKVEVYDAVFHTKTVDLSERSNKFMCFLIEIAVEHINEGYKRALGFEFRRLSKIVSVGTPRNQTVRRTKDKPSVSDLPVSLGPLRVQPEKSPAMAAPPAARSTAPPKAAPPKAASSETSTCPKTTILHRGEFDLTDAWNWKVLGKRIGVPKELVVKIEFPNVKSAAALDIDVQPSFIDVRPSKLHPFSGTFTLPFTVETAPTSAKFDKSQHVLTLVLRVIPPKALTEECVTSHSFPSREPAPADDEGNASPAKETNSAKSENETLEQSPKEQHTEPASAVASQHVDPSPPAGAHFEHLKDDSRTQKLRAQLEAARNEREEAERLELRREEEKKEADRKAAMEKARAEAAKAARGQQSKNTREPSRVEELDDEEEKVPEVQPGVKTQPVGVDAQHKSPAAVDALEETAQDREEASDTKQTVLSEESVEVIDLRKKQRAWLSDLQQASDSQKQDEGVNPPPSVAQQQAAEKEEFVDEEEARKQRQKQREARRAMEAQKEAERLEAELAKKMKELPLRSRHIFSLS